MIASKLLPALESVLRTQRKAVFTIPRKDEEVILLFSGGMDSVISAYMLIEKIGCKIIPMYIQRGARAEAAELASAIYFIKDIQARYPSKIRDLLIVDALYPPKSLKQYLPLEYKKEKGHPGRNMFLVLVAAYYLSSLKNENHTARTIFISNSPEDTFPHSSLAAVRSANIAVCVDQNDWDIQVTSPLFEPGLWGNIGKQQLVDYAQVNGIEIRKTHTCTAATEPCGQCGECKVRLRYLQ